MYSLWNNLGLLEKFSNIKLYTKEIREDYKKLNEMLKTPTGKGTLGELSLEEILKDQLPPTMFGIREKIIGNYVPDAYIKSTDGYICIDSKFSLDNYRRFLEAKNQNEKEKFKKEFIKN